MTETGEKNIMKFKKLTRIASGLIMLAILVGCGRTAEPGESSLEDSEQYAGVYYDYDTREPNLFIEKKDDGTYSIQIGIFRLVNLEDGTGVMTDDGIDFTATAPNGTQVSGIITLEGDTAVVTFTGSAWDIYSGIKEYRYDRTPDPGDSDGAQAGILENLAGSWRLDEQKTTEHLKAYDSLQAMWGTGLSYGSGMEIGADGSFSYYIAINYGGSGTVRETDGAILAEIVPYAPEGSGGSPDSLLITPVVEDGVTYLTTPYDGELMYWERCDSKTGD